MLVEYSWREEEKRVFANIWKSSAPSKVVAFSWKLLRDRVPTRRDLVWRTVFCGIGEESALHLFLHCDVAHAVWSHLMCWVDCFFLIPPNLFVLWDCWNGWETNKKLRRGLRLIWHTTIWLLWKARNCHIFNNVLMELDEIVEEVKVLSWRWMLDRVKMPVCLFYEWRWNPKDCLKR